ncbi:MAG TPA: polymer-forming cytoskeletal protein [Spirochaetota bacterium]|nr:polymer-forming cytoskeletal protein [Spirochaetota bacterium]HPV96834.1 polymer-forming cytoskeletal protein [Spirochaetota bacterium]
MARTSKQIEDNIVNSIIGEGSEFKGEFTVNGLLRIDGRFKGTIETDGKVLIGQSGEATTDIRARVVVIGGEVRGNIFATERVIMLATGRLYGNIITPSLVMEDGVIFDGNCVINKSPERLAAPQPGASERYGDIV